MTDFGKLARDIKNEIEEKRLEAERAEQDRLAKKNARIEKAAGLLAEQVRPSLEEAKIAFHAEGFGCTISEGTAERTSPKGQPVMGAQLTFACYHLLKSPGRNGGTAIFWSDGETVDVRYRASSQHIDQGFSGGLDEALEKAVRQCLRTLIEQA